MTLDQLLTYLENDLEEGNNGVNLDMTIDEYLKFIFEDH